jgi:hypothetical protein
MPEFLYYILPPFAFAGLMFLLYKWLEIAGVTSALDFDIEPRRELAAGQSCSRVRRHVY